MSVAKKNLVAKCSTLPQPHTGANINHGGVTK